MVNFLKTSQLEYSYASRLPNSEGAKALRLVLNSKEDNKTKIYAKDSFVFITYLFDYILSSLKISERKWVKIELLDSKNKTKTILININSLAKRTLLSRKEIIGKSPEELSSLLSTSRFNTYSNLNDYFPDILLINMDSRKEQIESLQNHLQRIGQRNFNYSRISAVNGRDPKLTKDIERMSKSKLAISKGKDDRALRLGAFYSHLNALKAAKASGKPSVLILEDDIRFLPDYFATNYIQKALSELPKDWGVLFLGHNDAKKEKAISYSDHLLKPAFPQDLHAWSVNSSMYDVLIELLEMELKKGKGEMRAIDVIISEELHKTGKIYATKDNIAIQDSSNFCEFTNRHYEKEFSKLASKMPSSLVDGKKTADGMPVIDPLLAGTFYQYLFHIDQLFIKNGIDYWIDAGTALGAERHAGLIPHANTISICIAPGMENKLKNSQLEKDLKSIGLRIEGHWQGAKIFALKDHPLGKTVKEGEYYSKTPCLDILFTEKDKIANEEVYFYKDNGKPAETNPRKCWDKLYYQQSEIYDVTGKIKRVSFGPIKVNGLQQGSGFCQRNYGQNCLNEIYIQTDPVKGKPVEKRPVRLTDYRSPAYRQWDGIEIVNSPSFPKS